MAGTTQVTHFNKVSGNNGVYTGPTGSEVQIDVGNQTYVVNMGGSATSTAADAAYITVPYAMNLVAAYATICAGTVGTGAQISCTLTDTAGAAQFTAASFTSAGTAGQQTLTFAGITTVQVPATGVLAIVKASCATAYGCTITIVGTKAS